jgi:hypothetical protein
MAEKSFMIQGPKSNILKKSNTDLLSVVPDLHVHPGVNVIKLYFFVTDPEAKYDSRFALGIFFQSHSYIYKQILFT